jgi:hypothetical protein
LRGVLGVGLVPKTAKNTQKGADSSTAKFRTTPIRNTITKVKQLPKSAIVYQCAASKYWQFRVYLEGAQRKRSTQKTVLADALKAAKLIYADMLHSVHGSEQGKRRLSGKRSIDEVADSLWTKQAVMIEQGELNPLKNKNDQYAFERHIKPFFKNIPLSDINADTLEDFKMHLAKQKLAKSSQKVYFTVLSKILKQAAKKQFIHSVPLMPTVRMDDEPRGYFDPNEYTKLWQTAKKLKDKTIFSYKDSDYVKGALKAYAKPYRKTLITNECVELILFMRNTYLRPTDIKVLKHKHIFFVTKADIEFLELRHPPTKRHHRVMVSTEHAPGHYRDILTARKDTGFDNPDDYVFMPEYKNREHALKALTRQFEIVLKTAELKTSADGKKRTLYSLRLTAIVRGIYDGISIETLALNSRTSMDMIDKFYGSHIKTALDKGTEIVDRIKEKNQRYAEKNKSIEHEQK